ncbi:hypothetical protein Tco_1569795 [Tanacetum coccineum]
MMHSILPCHVFIPAMSGYSFTMHHLASRLPSILHASCMVSYKDNLYKLLLVQVMDAPTIPVSVDSAQGSFRDMIDIGVDIIHPEPVAAVSFPSAVEELTALRFRVDIVEAENASLRVRIRTMEAIETVIRNHERKAQIEIERQLAAVQESHRQDRDFQRVHRQDES